MKAIIKQAVIFNLIVFMILIGLVSVSHAKQGSKGIASGVTAWGWCCRDGKIAWSNATDCVRHKGHFFKNKKDAQAYLDAQTPGYCCLKDMVSAMKKGDCLKKKGHFFKDRKAAATYCDLHQSGFCCLGGKVISALKGNCLKKKGHFFKDRKAATTWCSLHQPGWCVLKGRVFTSTKQTCLNKKGRFFTKKSEADRMARMAHAGEIAHRAENGKKTPSHLTTPGKTKITVPPTSPLLTAEKITLKDGTIHLKIKNSGKGRLSAAAYLKGSVMLQVGGTRKSWTLSKVDPKGNLKWGKEITFDTGIHLTKRTTAFVSFRHVPGQTKSALLIPPIGKFVKGAKKAPALHAAKTINPKPIKLRGKKNPKVKVPVAVPKDLEVHGVRIFTPTGREEYYPGETIHILYQITDDEVTNGTLTFSLSNSSESETFGSATVSVSSGREGETTIDIPRRISSGNYKITANFSARAGTSTSEDFSIYSDTVGINLEILRAGAEFFYPGNSFLIFYHLEHRVAPGPITFNLYNIHTHTIVASKTTDYRPGNPGEPENDHSVSLEIPRDLSSYGYYSVGVRHAHAFGISHEFVIRPPEGTEATWQIHVLSPAEGDRWPLNSTQHIEWRISGDYPPERHFLVDLLVRVNHGPAALIKSFSGDGATWNPTTRTYSLGWRIPRNLRVRDDYYIKVIDLNGPAKGTSESFSLTGLWSIHVNDLISPVPTGSTQTIVWVLHGDYRDADIHPENFIVQLFRGNTYVSTLPGTPVYYEAFHSFSLPWEILPRVFLGDSEESSEDQRYKIRVVDRRRRTEDAETHEFTFITPSTSGFQFTNPVESSTFYVGSSYSIQWETEGEAGGRVHLKLMRGEAVLQDIATVDASAGRYDWRIPGLCDGVTPVTGEGLRMRLITPRGDSGAHYHADSVSINVKMPKINIPWPFLPPIYHPADRISLSWTVEGNQLPADPRVNIKLYHNGSYLFTLANNVSTTFTGSTSIQAGTGNPWHGEIAPPGHNYKIRIEFAGCPQVYGETGNFTLLEAE